MTENEIPKIIIPMTVLAYRAKEFQKYIPQINPNYDKFGNSEKKDDIIEDNIIEDNIIGDDITPITFKTKTSLQEGVHLHFILPSAFRHGTKDKNTNSIQYPRVPDKFIVTRMFVDKNTNEIVHDCNIVDSAFISVNNNSEGPKTTIPYMVKNEKIKRYRYLGRNYSGFYSGFVEPPSDENSYLEDGLYAVGPGDPLFNVYYLNCRSVFGYYDNLKDDKIFDKEKGSFKTDSVTYSVIGYYSNAENDPFNKVTDTKTMEEVLAKYNFTIQNEDAPDKDECICNSCLLFGEVCNINIKRNDNKDSSEDGGRIDSCIGIGRTSAEALSAIICGENLKGPNEDKVTERYLTKIQYDLENESSQIDEQYKIEDSIHSHGFATIDPLENRFEITFPKDVKFNDNSNDASIFLSAYSDLCKAQNQLGKLRRELEYNKNTLYYLWEMYVKADYFSRITIATKINELIQRINELREDKIVDVPKSIPEYKKDIDKKIDSLNTLIKETIKNSEDVKIEEVASAPFYYPKDPALMIYGGEGKKLFAAKEADEQNKPLYCPTKPLSSDDDKITNLKNELKKKDFINEIKRNINEYLALAAMTVLLDPILGENISIKGDKTKYTKMVNENPDEKLILFMEWESEFYNDYQDSEPRSSSLEYGDTDYKYNGEKNNNPLPRIFGHSVLTPHGINNLIKKIGDDELSQKLRNKFAASQNLGGFTTKLSSLRYAFQLPMNCNDFFEGKVYKCLYEKNNACNEREPERLTVHGSNVIPLREGFLDIYQLALVTSFGERQYIIQNGKHREINFYVSENLHSNADNLSFWPLALTTQARLSSYFISAKKDPNTNEAIPSCSLPGSTPVIGIIMPDILNRNLNIYDNTGKLLGIIKRIYRENDVKEKKAFGTFVKLVNENIDCRIKSFIDTLTNNNDSYFTEIMDVIEKKLDTTIPMAQNDFIFGRILVLTEINIGLEYYGGTEFSKDTSNIKKLDDKGLMEQKFSVMIGDVNRVTDGVICGFYDDEGNKKGFAAFGYDTKYNKSLKDPQPTISGSKSKEITLLLDPTMNVTLTTGFLPVEQIHINATHTDFSKMNLMSAEMNTLISESTRIQLPDFTKGEKYSRDYPISMDLIDEKNDENSIEYESLNVVKAGAIIDTDGKTMITDGFLVKQTQNKPQV